MSNYPCVQNINQPHIFIISACQGKEADIVFVVDCSSSIWSVDFKKQLQFISDVVSHFDVQSGKTQVPTRSF